MKTSTMSCGERPSLIARIRRGATGLAIGRPRVRAAKAIGSFAIGSFALGAFATLATYVGTLAIGRVAIGRLAMGKARIKRLRIDDLEVGKIHFLEQETRAAFNGQVAGQAEPVGAGKV